MTQTPLDADISARAGTMARDANLVWVAQVLGTRRQEILDAWLEATAAQPFHDGRRERAVADDVPRLLDALIEYLLQHGPPSVDAGPPLAEPEIQSAAESHSRARVAQGLLPGDVVVEFRILRQEIWRILREGLPEDAPPDDVSGATLLINDALDGAITLGLNALLDRVEQSRQQLIATLMHDIRTPITAVKGWAQLILRQESPDPSMAQPILEAANRLQRMTDDLLEMGALEAGRFELRREPTDLVELARGAIAALEQVAPNHQFRLDSTTSSLEGLWDRDRLDRVLQNLFTNAVKYSPQDSEILVTVGKRGSFAEIRVTDHGIGIPTDALNRIFDQFYRVREQTSGAEGLGLGLFIAQRIVEAHRGQIRAESPGVGEGSTLIVALPL